MTNEEAIEDIEKNIKPIIGGNSLELAIKSLKQNSVIKGELKSEREWRFNARVEMLDKKAEIEILLEENAKLKAEIEQLKSEVEQSVKEKSEVISKIEYALNECEPIYNKCAVVPQVKPIYDLAMNYCLDLLKGETKWN